MSRVFSFGCNILSAIMFLLIIALIKNYYFLVTESPLSNTPTQVVFWCVLISLFIVAIAFVFFKKWIYKKRKKLFFAIVIFFLGIVFIEITLRALDNRPLRFSHHPYLNYFGTPNYKSWDGLNIHNSLGFRGPEIKMPKPKGRIRVALLGGSTTYEDLVRDWRKDWARKLQQYLEQSFPGKDIEVINAGLAGWDSWEDLVNLEFKLIYLDLDLIIVYEGTNDVHARFVRPDAYRPDNTGNKKQWKEKPCFNIGCLKIVQYITGVDANSFDIIADTAAQFPISSKYNSILDATPMDALIKNPPIYSERNLRNIIAIARENEINVLLSTWAWTDQFKNEYAATSHYQKGFIEQNNMIRKVAEEKGVSLYDFAPEMPMDKEYWGDGRHNNEKGVDLKAKLFANFITKNNILELVE